jgi:hypothetical protein
MLRDDPGGYFAAGYRDGTTGKKFNPVIGQVPQSKQTQPSRRSLSDLERAWYWLCDSSEFIALEIANQYTTALRAQGSTVAMVIGLSDFTDATCPRCGCRGQFKVHFLGRINHPACGWIGYMGTGSYIGHQLMQIMHSGYRAGGSMKNDADRKGDTSGGWVYGIFAFVAVAFYRALLAVVLIPVHMIVALSHPKETKPST